jgi:uncharacterized membrane protein YdjX (TVP38/TMEM64 family)
MDAGALNSHNTESGHKKARGWLKPVIIVAVLIGAIVAMGLLLPVTDSLRAVLEWAEGLGLWGPVVVVGIYIVACVLFLPGSVLTLGAGFLFGVVTGTITVSIGATLGACAAFLVGRTIARKSIEKKVAGNAKFAAIDQAVGREGFKIVLLTRLSPIFPFNLQNYAYGLTKVSLRNYALASWIGMLPGTLMYVYFGSTLKSLAEAAAGKEGKSTLETVFFIGGLVVALVVVVFVTRVARKALARAVPPEAMETSSGKGEQS